MSDRPTDRFGFRSTLWSLVEAAGDTADPLSHEALAELCRRYWPPIYTYIRRRGNDAETARDLTQGFFALFLEKKHVKAARRERGKFRAFLLASVKHYLTNQWEHEHAGKRGGGVPPVTLELERAERLHRSVPEHARSPEQIFERQWALTLLDHTMDRLEAEAVRSHRPERFEALKPFLTDVSTERSYKQIAEELGMSESAVKVAVHRLRRRFGELLREEVAQTLDDPDDADDEIRFLFHALR